MRPLSCEIRPPLSTAPLPLRYSRRRASLVAEEDFADLLRRLRAGDADAARQLVARYEPEIRRTVRIRLTDPRLRRVLDSTDVCQSVLANFFVRVSAGEFDLSQPEQLTALLL